MTMSRSARVDRALPGLFDQLAEARTAVANCPEKAISFVDDLNLSLALNEETTS